MQVLESGLGLCFDHVEGTRTLLQGKLHKMPGNSLKWSTSPESRAPWVTASSMGAAEVFHRTGPIEAVHSATLSWSSRQGPDGTLPLVVDDGLCAPLFYGCNNPTALNYKSLYNADDGSCICPAWSTKK